MNAAERLIRSYYDAFNAGDEAAFLALLSEDVAHDISQGERQVGKAAFARFLAHMNRCYRERITDIIVLTEPGGTRAAAEFTVHGTYLVTDPGVPAGTAPAHGQPYTLPAGAFFSLREGVISRVSNHYNLGDWIAQVGRGMKALVAACASIAAMALYRTYVVETALCDVAAPPLACLPRPAVFWLTYQYGFGLAALVLGLAAFLSRSSGWGAAAFAAGVIAVLNYNATWGMVGAALGAWTWCGRTKRSNAGAARTSAAAFHTSD